MVILAMVSCHRTKSVSDKHNTNRVKVDMSQQDSIQKTNEDSSKALITDHGLYELYEKRAQKYYDQKKYNLAIEEFQKMIELEPENVTGYMGIGYIANEQKKWNESVRIFSDIIKIADDFSYAYSFRAEAFLGLKRWDEATDDLIKAISLSWDQKALYLIEKLQEPALTILILKVYMKQTLYPNEEKWERLLSFIHK